MNCESCEKLEYRVKALEAMQPGCGVILVKFILMLILIPLIGSTVLTSIDYRIQVQAQHPDWTRQQVSEEAWSRQWTW